MTREERHALLGEEVLAEIRERVAQAPEPTDELVEKLRRIMTRPAGLVPQAAPAGETPPAAQAA
ncbi:hypothetical protein [Streptomyces pactum]|uniref:Uncharacterized protein n=1 Tax=Streptomyces pactum TaxID=68249 RepID=A0A1S6JGN6_9ACTN|nr:hypothetical protein [Streptomyces pactum]AQS70892.1 hypothetical protein B1H29_31940 [Streptomyces pactum]